MAFYASRFKQLLANLHNYKNQTIESKGLGSKFKLTSDPKTITELYANPAYTRSRLSRRMVEHDGAYGAAVSQADDRAAVKRSITAKHLNNQVYRDIASTAWAKLEQQMDSMTGEFDILQCIKVSLHYGFLEHYLGVNLVDTELEAGVDQRNFTKSGYEESFEKLFILNYFPMPLWVKDIFSPRLKAKNAKFAELVEYIYSNATAKPGSLFESLKAHETDGILSHNEVLGEIRAAIIGANTLAVSLMWSVYTVGSQHTQHIAQVQASDAYSRYAYMETLRLYPPFHMLTYEAASRCPFHFSKNPTVIVGVAQTHRSPVNWENPEEFRPTRFAKGLNNITKGSYIPFGGGARSCSGAAASMHVGPSLLRKLFTNYQFTKIVEPVVKRRIELTTENSKFFVQVSKL